MRTLIFAFAVTVASVASAQYPGGVVVLGPYQPSPWGGSYYYNPSAPYYRGPVASPYYWDEGYASEREIRLIRWELEDRSPYRRNYSRKNR